jgi:23S rRNA pseudouridine2457 synthase
MTTIALNKPYDVLTKFTDDDGRPTLADYVDVPGVYPAGRLDRDSEGLLLLTSDGGLQHHIADPHEKLAKVYLVQVERIPDEAALAQLRTGVVIKGERTHPAQAELIDDPGFGERSTPIRYRKNVPTAWLRLTIHEGRNRQVRRMTAAVGHPTLRLVRWAIGPISIEGLGWGAWRELDEGEIKALWAAGR